MTRATPPRGALWITSAGVDWFAQRWDMSRFVPLPPEFSEHAFSVARAREAGLAPGRLRGSDLSAPFYGVRRAQSVERSGPPESGLLELCLAYAERMRPGQFLSHITAARLWGAPLREPYTPNERLHVSTLTPQQPPRTRGVVGHELPAGAAAPTLRFGFPVADAASTWLQLATVLPPAELVVVGDHLVLDPYLLDPRDPRPFTTIAALGERVAGYRGRGKRTAVQALARVRMGAESRPETLLRLILIDAALPEPLLNQNLKDAAGHFLGRGDLVYPEWRVLVEYDGDQHRSSTAQYDRDLTRLDGIRRAGWVVISVRKYGLFSRPDVTIAKVRTALLEAGWRP